MVVVSYSGKEINAKLVYYGAGLCGKTTNLESIYEAVPDTSRGKMVSMKTQSDRTLFFDLLPLDLGEIMGFKTRFLLYTVPGQVFYNATRKLVLKGADAIVFVADSEVGKMEENKDSLANLRANLAEYGLSLDTIPWVIQYNKRDLPNVYTLDELNAELNVGGKVPFFEAVAKDGKGVFETFRGISHLLMEKVTKDLRRGPGAPMAQAPSAPVQAAATPKTELRPAALAGSTSHAPEGAAGPGGLDYGREIELPGQKVTSPPPAIERLETEPVTRYTPPQPVEVAQPVAAVAAPAPRPEPVVAAPQPSRPVRVAQVVDAEAMPAPPVHAASVAPMAARSAQAAASDEMVVPVTISANGTHEIVLRIVLKVEK